MHKAGNTNSLRNLFFQYMNDLIVTNSYTNKNIAPATDRGRCETQSYVSILSSEVKIIVETKYSVLEI